MSSSTVPATAEETYSSAQFDFINDKLRQHVKLANDEIDNVKDKVNELVVIVHDDNLGWSLKKICGYIAGRNDDLAEYGFSARTIHRYLDEQNLQLVDKRQQRVRGEKPKGEEYQPSKSLEELRQQKGTTIEQKNVMEESGDTCHPNIIEQSSSITNTSREEEELRDLPEPVNNKEEEIDVIYENTINNYAQKIAQLEEEIIQLKQQQNNKFTFEYDLEGRGQILPLVVTAFKDKETGFVRLNKNPTTTTKKK